MSTAYNLHGQNRGFSLVEMAIVLTIVALLLAGLLPSLTSQIEQSRRNDTRKILEEIQQALIGYAIVNTKLPCPAQPATATGSAGAGVADCTIATVANTVNGVVPWVTLGVSETDAWGRRFTYSIASSVAGGAFGTSFTLSSTGTIDVASVSGGTNYVGSDMPAVVISHGSNGLGAYLPTGGAPLATDPTHTDELANSDGSAPFVTHDNTTDFDDTVIWLSPNVLFSRMVQAGKLP